MSIFFLLCAFIIWTADGRWTFTLAVAILGLLLLVSYSLLLKITRSCPSEAVEFTCSNSDIPVVMWTVTSSTSGFSGSISFHSIFNTQGIWRSAVIDDSVVNATLLYGNSSWYLTSLSIPSTLTSDIRCNSEFLQYHFSNGKSLTIEVS